MDDLFILSDDVLIFPVEDLQPDLRERLTWTPGDFVLTKTHSRMRSKIVDPCTAQILNALRNPARLPEVISQVAANNSLDAEATAQALGPELFGYIQRGILIPADENTARSGPWKHPGETYGDYTIDKLIQRVDKAEIYRASNINERVVLKVGAIPGAPNQFDPLANEADILTHLAGIGSPKLVSHRVENGHRILAVEFISGSDPITAARRARTNNTLSRQDLKRIVLGVANAYSALHDRGVLHGDVHPKNIIIMDDLSPMLIDFGFAVRSDGTRIVPRVGIERYLEPECAQMMLRTGRMSHSSCAGEQYSVASVVYELLAGQGHFYQSPEKERLLRQIVEDDPLPLGKIGLSGFKPVEIVLRKALAKRPEHRFDTMRDFANALVEAWDEADRSRPQSAAGKRHAAGDNARQFLENCQRAEFIDDVLSMPPACSVNFGGAGVAYALYRAGLVSEDAERIELAEMWIARTRQCAVDRENFFNKTMDLTQATVRDASILHGIAGVHYVRMLIARAGRALGTMARNPGPAGRFHREYIVGHGSGARELSGCVGDRAGIGPRQSIRRSQSHRTNWRRTVRDHVRRVVCRSAHQKGAAVRVCAWSLRGALRDAPMEPRPELAIGCAGTGSARSADVARRWAWRCPSAAAQRRQQ